MKVRVLTFNVWFEPVHMEVRMEAIGRVVERTRPAVMGFQELTRESLAMLRRQRWAKFYDCSVDVAPPRSDAYFVALFSALPVLQLSTLPFANSGMGRELVAARVELAPGRSLVVGTSHLESMPELSRARVAQLREAMYFLEELVESAKAWAPASCVGAVFMGDTNLMRADLRVMDPTLGRVAGKLEVEHAKSGRAKCRRCDETIPKGEVRVGKIGADTLPNGRHVQLTMWHHQRCFDKVASADERRVVQSFLEQVRAADAKTSPTAATLAAVAAGAAAAAATPGGVDLASLGLPAGWKDLWLTVSGNTDENGYTFDGRENGHVTSRAFRSRLDRVYFYPGAGVREAFAASSQAVLEGIQIVGKEPISATLWPSDHFGLLASFDFDAGDDDATAASSAATPASTPTTPTAGVKHEAQVAGRPAAAKKPKPGSSKETALAIE
ncbi:hypothetical protein PybrP1_009190 [[Pythium] brassicae (nom. inval.)]|nr:hypothetical protein PybrP1_009190 [[Pythium] brassicae (nom. inval.)]